MPSGGNPACWHGDFGFDTCCGPEHGPLGNPDCWDDAFTFDTCCLSASRADASCWEEARRFVGLSGDAIAAHPSIRSESSLQRFCCYPTEYTSQVCWGAGRQGGSPLVLDSASSESLNFTERFVECCLPRLRDWAPDAEAVAPQWMADQVASDLRAWERRGAIGSEDLDAVEASLLGDDAHRFCRFRIRGRRLLHCDFSKSGHTALLDAMRAALHVLLVIAPLPNIDFLVNTDEFFCVAESHMQNLSVPVLVQAQPEGCGGVLVPWWANTQLAWTRLYASRMQATRLRHPWVDREPLLFWRGSDTGCLLPGGCERGRCNCSQWTRSTWPTFPRSRLVLFSTLVPDRIDARYTKSTVHLDCEETYDSLGLRLDEIVAPEAHASKKFLAYIDGTSFSDRMYWLLHSGSLVFRAESQLHVWLDGGLRPWVHYVPVRENLTDLIDRLDWARGHDSRAAEIAAEAVRFAAEEVSLEGCLLYLLLVLRRLAAIFRQPLAAVGGRSQASTPDRRSSPKAPRAEGPARAEGLFEGSVECWAYGYSPEVCCDRGRFGPRGNDDCWAGPFTYETCCLGLDGTTTLADTLA